MSLDSPGPTSILRRRTGTEYRAPPEVSEELCQVVVLL